MNDITYIFKGYDFESPQKQDNFLFYFFDLAFEYADD